MEFGFAFISYIMHWILGIKILENSIEILLWWSPWKWEESKTMDLNVELHLGWGSCRNVVIVFVSVVVSVVVSVFVTVFNQWQIICICLVWWWLSEAGLSRWKGGNAKGASLTFRPLDTRGVQRHYEVDISKAAKTFPVPLWLFCSANLQQGKVSNFRPKKS